MSSRKREEYKALLNAERKRQAEGDLRWLLASKEGRRVYWRLLEVTNVFGPSFVDSASRTAWLEGKRTVGIDFMLEVQRLAPAEHVLTIQEALKSKHDEESRRPSAPAPDGDDEDDD